MRHQIVWASIAVLLLCVLPVFGQGPKPSTEGWKFEYVPYFWVTTIHGREGINDHDIDVNAGYHNVFAHLHFAFMSAGEVSWNNKYVFGSDFVYTDIRVYQATPGPPFSDVAPGRKLFLMTPEGGYRFVDTNRATVDGVAGIRYWRVSSELHFLPAAIPGLDLAGQRNWVDGIVGAKGKVYLPKRWFVSGYGDVGGGGSNLTYQVMGTVGGDLDEHFSVFLGYRYLNVNYNKNGFLFDNKQQGPIFGATIKFW